MSHASGGGGGGPHAPPPPVYRPPRAVASASTSSGSIPSLSPSPLPSPSLRRWNTRLQAQLLAKCSSGHEGAAASAAAIGAASEGAYATPVAAGTAPLPSAAALTAVSASSTFLHLIHAIQSTHPQRRNYGDSAAGGSTQAQRQMQLPISTAATFFPLHSNLPTLLEMLQQRGGAGCATAGNLYRTWSGGGGGTAASSSAAAPFPSASASAASRSRAAAPASALQSAPPRFSDDLLLARLVSRPSAAHASLLKAQAGLGHLYLEDQSACVAAILVGADTSLLGRWCLFPTWTLLLVPPVSASLRSNAAVPQGVFEIHAHDAIPIPALSLHTQQALPKLELSPLAWPGFAHPPSVVQAAHCQPLAFREAARLFDRRETSDAAGSAAAPIAASVPAPAPAAKIEPVAASSVAAAIAVKQEPEWEECKMSDAPPIGAPPANCSAAFGAALTSLAAAATPATSARAASGADTARSRRPPRSLPLRPPPPMLDDGDEGESEGVGEERKEGPASSLAPCSSITTMRDAVGSIAALSFSLTPIASAPRGTLHAGKRKSSQDPPQLPLSSESMEPAPPTPAAICCATPLSAAAAAAAAAASVAIRCATPLSAATIRSTPLPAAAAPVTSPASASATHDMKRQKLHASAPSVAASAAVVTAAALPKKRPPSVFHLRGTIQALSPIIHRDAAVFFFIDLRELAADAGVACSSSSSGAAASAPASALSTVLLFTGASAVRWYPFLRVGCSYLFTRLRVSTVLRDASSQGRMVCANTFAMPVQQHKVQQHKQQQLPQYAPTQEEEEESPFESRAKQTLIFPIHDDPAPVPSKPPASVPPASPSPGAPKLDPAATKMDSATSTPSAVQHAPTFPAPPSTSGSLSMPFIIPTPASASPATPTSAIAVAAAGNSRTAPHLRSAARLPLPSTLSYTGTITSIPSWGVLDLDGGGDDGSGSGGGSGGQRCFMHPLCFVGSGPGGGGGGGVSSLMLRWGVGLRVGARITLHNVHPLVQGRRHLGFLCCFASQLEILALSPWDRLAEPFDATRAAWYANLWRRYAARDVALMLTLFLEARRKLGASLSSRRMLETPAAAVAADAASSSATAEHASGGWILRLLSPLLSSCSGSPLDEAQLKAVSLEMYEQFFRHAEGCPCPLAATQSVPLSFSLRQQRALPFPVLLPLADLMRLRAVRRFAEQLAPKPLLSSPGPSAAPVRARAPVHEEWSYRFVHSRVIAEMHPQVVIVGVLQSSLAAPRALGAAGLAGGAATAAAASASPVLRCALQLSDRSGSIDCVVLGELLPAHVNAVLHIRSYAIIMELSPATALAGSDAASALVSVLVFDIKDAVIVQPAALAAGVSTAVAASRSAAAAAASSNASRSFYVMHKSDSIVKPSLSAPAASPAAAAGAVALFSSTLGAASKSSQQPKLSAASFQPTLHTQVEVLLRDGDDAGSAESFRPATLQVDGAGGRQLFPFLPLHRAVHIGGVEAVRGSAADQGRPPCFRLTAASRLLSVRPLPSPLSAQTRMLDVRDVLVCPLPRSAPPPYTGTAAGVEIDRVSFRGLVLEKQFCEASHGSSSGGEATAPGGQAMRRWWLNVRDVSELHTLSVHLDVSACCFPAALVPGSLVRFHRVSRMLSARSLCIYAEAGPDSYVSVEACVGLAPGASALMHQDGEEPGTDGGRRVLRVALHTHYPVRSLPDTLLASLSPFAPSLSMRTLSLRVRVVLLKKLVMQWKCGGCGRELLPGAGRCVARPSSLLGGGLIPACVPSAAAAPVCFLDATCVVDDGTAVAMLYVEGDAVWDLLGLTPRRRAQLEEISRERGSLEYFHMSRAAAAAAAAEDSGVDGSGAASSSSLFVSARDLRTLQLSLWDRHFRESYPGRQFNLKAHQCFLRHVILQSMTRKTKGERNAATEAAGAAAAGASSGLSSSAASSAASAAGSAPSSSIPFDACQTRKIFVGPKLSLPTLQAPTITLRAVAIEPINCRAEATKLLWMLKNGANSS